MQKPLIVKIKYPLLFTLINSNIFFLHALSLTDFLPNTPIKYNEKDDIIELSNLQLYKPKPKGGCSGGIYRASNQTYYVKQTNPFTELIGAKFMNSIVGTLCTPLIKIVKDEVNYVASLELANFQTQKFFDEKYPYQCKNVIGEVDLTIAMDFLGLVDRHDQNIGYVLLPDLPPIAARIDFDTSFSFDKIPPSHNTEYNPNSNHLSLELLYHSIKKYPKQQIINSIKKISQIPDEQIFMIIMQSYLALSQIEQIELEPFLHLANKLIERKNLFHKSIENRSTPIYKAIQRQYFKSKYRAFNNSFREIFPICFSTILNQIEILLHQLLFKNNSTQVPMAILN